MFTPSHPPPMTAAGRAMVARPIAASAPPPAEAMAGPEMMPRVSMLGSRRFSVFDATECRPSPAPPGAMLSSAAPAIASHSWSSPNRALASRRSTSSCRLTVASAAADSSSSIREVNTCGFDRSTFMPELLMVRIQCSRMRSISPSNPAMIDCLATEMLRDRICSHSWPWSRRRRSSSRRASSSGTTSSARSTAAMSASMDEATPSSADSAIDSAATFDSNAPRAISAAMWARSSATPEVFSTRARRSGSAISAASTARRLDTPMTGTSRPRCSRMRRRSSSTMARQRRRFLSVFVTATTTDPAAWAARARMSISGAVIGVVASHTMSSTPAPRARSSAMSMASRSRPPAPGVSMNSALGTWSPATRTVTPVGSSGVSGSETRAPFMVVHSRSSDSGARSM